jgi:hypothetical protein
MKYSYRFLTPCQGRGRGFAPSSRSRIQMSCFESAETKEGAKRHRLLLLALISADRLGELMPPLNPPG